jgi:hypothetical protein
MTSEVTKTINLINMRTTRSLLTLLLFLIALPLAVADGNDEQDRNRKLLEKAKSDPQHYARLIQDLHAFMALPEERQNELRKLDHDLHDQNSASYASLQRALERYADWLRRLPEGERSQIEATTDPKGRLRLIKQIREHQWISRLPKARQEELAKLQADPSRYQQRLKELRQEERQRHKEWAYAIRNWSDVQAGRQALERLPKLKPELTVFVRDGLMPLLSDVERQRLKADFEAAEKQGQWVDYFTTLVGLADKHPIKQPPPANLGPRRFSELPPALQARLKQTTGWPPSAVVEAEGKWPDYALEVVKVAREHRIPLPKPLGPTKVEDLAPSVQTFCKEKLFPILSESERENLRNRAQGFWPAYPNRLMALANKHKLQIPGMALPGPQNLWQVFRKRVNAVAETAGTAPPQSTAERPPDVSDRTLREFVQKELSPAELAELPSVSLGDPEARELIKQKYFTRHPDVLKRLQKADQNKQFSKGAKK